MFFSFHPFCLQGVKKSKIEHVILRSVSRRPFFMNGAAQQIGDTAMRKKKAVSQALYDASKELFLKKGYDAVSIDEICAKVGISKPTFYAADLKKHELLIHLYKPANREAVLSQEDLEQLENDPVSCFLDLVDEIIETFTAYGTRLLSDLYQVLIQENAIDDLIDDGWRNRMILLLSTEQIQGLLRIDLPPDEICDLVCCYILGSGSKFALGNRDASLQTFHDGLKTLFRIRQEEVWR